MLEALTASRWRPVRWALLVLLALGVVVAWAAGPPEQCRDAATDAGVVQVCEPVGLTSPPVLVLLLVAALLLVPDFAEVQLGGVLGLRRELAETKTEVATVQRELAQIDLDLVSIRAATEAVARAAASAESESHLHLHVERQAATAAAVEAARAAAPIVTSRRPPGAYASAAVHAGMLGMAAFFPTWCGPVQVVGLTLDGDDLEVTHDYAGVAPRQLDRVRALLAEPSTGVLVDVDETAWIAACPARDDDGATVGALGVVLTAPEGDPGDGEELSTARLEELAAAVETAASTYARLLVDLLGERPAGRAGTPGQPTPPAVVRTAPRDGGGA